MARQPQTMHGAAAVLAQAYPGRFVLGLKVGHSQQAADVGQEFGIPSATTRDYVDRMAAPAQPPAHVAVPPRSPGWVTGWSGSPRRWSAWTAQVERRCPVIWSEYTFRHAPGRWPIPPSVLELEENAGQFFEFGRVQPVRQDGSQGFAAGGVRVLEEVAAL
jgi:hypothetical protein